MRDAGGDSWTREGKTHRGMVMGLVWSLPSTRSTKTPDPPPFSRVPAAAVGMGVPTHPLCGWLWGERSGWLPSLPPPKSGASGSDILLPEVPGSYKQRSARAPPGAGRRWGPGQSPGVGSCCWGWWLRRGREPRQLRGLGAVLARACSWLRPRPGIPFPRKNTVNFFFFSPSSGCSGGLGMELCLRVLWKGKKDLAGELCQGTLSCNIPSQRLPNLAF